VAGKPDAVVQSSPILREVVGADLLRTVAAADLAAPVVALGGLLPFEFDFIQAASGNSFMAWALFLCWLFSCWQCTMSRAGDVVNAHRRVSGVDRWPPGPPNA